MLNDFRFMFRGRDPAGPVIIVFGLLGYGVLWGWTVDIVLSAWGL